MELHRPEPDPARSDADARCREDLPRRSARGDERRHDRPERDACEQRSDARRRRYRGGAGVTVDSTLQPIALGGGVYRFFLDGAFTPGAVTVSLAGGSFTDSNGYANAASSEAFSVLGPTASLQNPGSGAAVGAAGLNGEGYIDVPFTAPSGETLDPTTITDASTVFTLSGASGFTVDATKAPVLVSHTGSSWVYRYWTTGAYTSGSVSITFQTGGYGFTDGSRSTFVGPVNPVNFTVDGVATPNIHYLDVALTPTSGDTIDLSSVASTPSTFTLSGAGASGVQLLADATPTQLPGTATFRYYVSGSFGAGAVTLGFPAGSFTSSSAAHPAGYGNLASSDSFLVAQPTAALADPPGSSVSSVQSLNGRSFVDVTYTIPSYATGLDLTSVTSTSPAFTIAAADPSAGTVALDTTQAPLYLGETGGAYTFRYFTTGTLRSGNVVLTYIGGRVAYLDAAGASIPLFAPEQVQLAQGTGGASDLVVSVAFGSSQTLDTSSIGPGAISIAGATVQSIDTTPTVGTYAFHLTSSTLASGDTVTVTFNAGAWTYAGAASVVESSATVALTGDTYVDVAFTGAGSATPDVSTINGDELQLSGSGVGTAAIDSSVAPTVLGNGSTVRYYLTGQFTPGVVHVSFVAGSWQDTAGNQSAAGSTTLRLIDQLPASAASSSSSTDGRVFFIALSGGVDLNAAGLFDTGGKPLLSIHGGVELDIGTTTTARRRRRRRASCSAPTEPCTSTSSGTSPPARRRSCSRSAARPASSSGASPRSRRTSTSSSSTGSTSPAARCSRST